MAPLREHPEVGEVRQAGLMVGIELGLATRRRVSAGRPRSSAAAGPRPRRGSAGLLTRGLLDDILCLAPPFTISDELMERSVEILGESIDATGDLHR